jgi:hypothetical protein
MTRRGHWPRRGRRFDHDLIRAAGWHRAIDQLEISCGAKFFEGNDFHQ